MAGVMFKRACDCIMEVLGADPLVKVSYGDLFRACFLEGVSEPIFSRALVSLVECAIDSKGRLRRGRLYCLADVGKSPVRRLGGRREVFYDRHGLGSGRPWQSLVGGVVSEVFADPYDGRVTLRFVDGTQASFTVAGCSDLLLCTNRTLPKE